MTKLLFTIFITLSISCTTYHVQEEHLDLRSGMSLNEFEAKDISADEYTWEDEITGSRINFLKADIMTTVHSYSSYYYLFVDEKLYYFGTAQKFIKHPDPLVRRVIKEAQVRMD